MKVLKMCRLKRLALCDVIHTLEDKLSAQEITYDAYIEKRIIIRAEITFLNDLIEQLRAQKARKADKKLKAKTA